MCERDSSQAQLMVKDQETSVTMKGMEMMVEAMNSEQLGEVIGTRVHTVRNARLKTYVAGGTGTPACTWRSTTGRTPQQLGLGCPPGDRWRLTRGRRCHDHDVTSLLLSSDKEHMTDGSSFLLASWGRG